MPKHFQPGNFHKIDSHLSKDEAKQKGFTSAGWDSNSRADYWAGISADANQFPQEDIEVQKKAGETRRAVIARLLAVHRILLQEEDKMHDRRNKPQDQTTRSRRKEVIAMGAAQGHQLTVGKLVKCNICNTHSGITKCWQWIHNPCDARKEHSLRTTHGLTYCQKCGFWDSQQGKTSRGLKGPCQPKAVPAFRRNILRRLHLPEPQPPPGVTWPDGTPSGIRKRIIGETGGSSTQGNPAKKSKDASVKYRPLPILQSIRDRVRKREAEQQGG